MVREESISWYIAVKKLTKRRNPEKGFKLHNTFGNVLCLNSQGSRRNRVAPRDL